MAKLDRVLLIVKSMGDEERQELFEELDGTWCIACGIELPDEDSKEPDHQCEFAEDDDEDGGDDGDPDSEDEDADDEENSEHE